MSALQEYMQKYGVAEGASTNDAPVTAGIDYSKITALSKPAPVKDVGGFVAAGKRAVGAGLQGVGQLAADFVPGVSQDNALTTYGKGVVEANAPAITSLSGIAERPGMALKEATGNVAGSVGTALGLRALGQGITAASPITGPAAPLTAAVGQAISWGSPILAGLLPSFGGIREQQIAKDAGAATSAGEKLTALGGATVVGAIEKFGPEGWAVAAMNKDARKALVGKFAGTGTLQRMGMAGAKGAAVEGSTEMVQNPIEQWASGDNPLTPAALKDTLFAGAMGAIGGGTVGSAFGLVRDKPAGQVTNDDLKGATDEQLAPPAAPAEPMADEYSRMQREFEVANQPQGNRYPELAESSDEELQRMDMLLGSKEGQSIANAKDIKAAIAEELQARAKAAEPTLAQQNDARIAQAWGRPDFDLQPTPVGDVPHEAAVQEGIAPATDLTATFPMFDAAGRVVAPEPTMQADWDRMQAAQAEQVARAAREREIAAEQQARAQSVKTEGRGTALAADREMARIENRQIVPAAGKDLFGPAETAEAPAARMTKQDEALTQQLNVLEQRAVEGVATPQEMSQMQQLRDRLTPKAEAASAGAPAADFVKQYMPRKTQVSAKLATVPIDQLPDALAAQLQRPGATKRDYAPVLAQMYSDLTGGLDIQNHASVQAQQASAALQGFEEAPTQGRIENVQGTLKAVPRLTAQQQRQNMMATETSVAAGQSPAAALGVNIPEVPNAVQEQIPAAVDVRQPTKAGKQVAKGNTQKTVAAKGQAVQGEVNGATPIVVEQGSQGASDNAPASPRVGRAKRGDTGQSVRGRTGASAGSDNDAVAVGSATSERPTGVAPEADEVSPFAKPEKRDLEFAGYRDAYLDLRKPKEMSLEAFTKKRAKYLQSLAEMERNADSTASKKAAKTFLDEQAANDVHSAQAVKMARRLAEQFVETTETKKLGGRGEIAKKAVTERNARIAEREAAWEAQLQDMDDTQKRKQSRTDKQIEKALKGQASGTDTTPLNPNVHTLRSLAEELVKTFGEDMRGAIMAGRVKLVINQTHLAAETGDMSRRGQITQGMYYYNPKAPAGTGTVYFVAGNLAKTQQGYTAFDVALHEIGEHAGMEQMLGKARYQQLMSSIRKSMAVETPKTQFDKDVAAAKKKLLGDQQGQAHEVLAYMIQHTPDSSGLQKMWAAIKAFAARFGLLPDSMKDAATMRALAEGATAQWLKGVAEQTAARGVAGQASGSDLKGILTQLEGASWANEQKNFGAYGFDTFERLWREAVAMQKEYPDYSVYDLYRDGVGGTGVVYGSGGYNRYAVGADGSLYPMPESFANAGKLAKAQEMLSTPLSVGAASSINNPEMRTVFANYGEAAQAAKAVLGKVEGMKAIEWQNKRLGAFKLMSSWITKHHMVAQFDKWFNGALAKNAEADTIQQATSARTAQLFNEPYNRLRALPQELQAKVARLMEATEFKIDPRKGWDAHTHLQGLAGEALTQAKKYHAEYKQLWGQLNNTEQGKVARDVYNDLAAMNEALYTMELAVSTYNMVHANAGPAKDLPAFKADPTEKFRQSTSVHGSIEAAHTYWKGVLNDYTEQLDKYVAEQRGLLPAKSAIDPEVAAAERKMLKGVQNEKVRRTIKAQLRTRTETLNDEQKKIVRHLTPLEAQLRMSNETTETFKHAPYFHLGRFGDHFVSFRVRADEGDQADPKAMAHVQQVLAKEFPDVAIRSDATDPHVFARFESVDQAAAFEERARALQKEGWLMQPGTKDKNNEDYGLIRRGKKQEIIAGYHTAGPNWLSRVVESIQAEGFDDEVTKQMVAHVRSMYLDSLPDTAAIKVKQRREGRPGWHKDMVRNYAHRMRVGSNRVASLAAEPTRTQSFAEMSDALSKAETDPKISTLQHNKMSVIVDELQKRNSNQMSVPHTPGVDMLRALNHAYFLGMSPSYLLIQMTQLGVLAWPELAKRYGFVKSAKALGTVTNTAFKVVGAVLREGYKTRGVKGAADMVITGDILEKAGLTKGDAEFLVKIMAAGKLDIGNAARNVGRVAEGETGSEVLKVATSMGYASEMLTRTITALAAKKLYDGKPEGLEQYAINVIDESMLDYTIENEGRMMGKQGVVGAASPVMFSFMKYQAQLLEKLYREVYSAYSKDATDAQKAEARKFLGGHMIAMMSLAGSLGMPFATAIAAAADGLCEMFGDGHCDSKIAMRNMTAEVFGHDIEPLLSKGIVSRAVGVDISERAGEGNLLPFSKFLADKRAMEDKLKDLTLASWGAPTSMIANMLKGYEKLSQGDLLGGMQEAVPLALKGPIKAYEMSEKGYTDKAGNVLPMTPGAYDILLQTIGLNPGEKADYQQAKFAQSQRSGVLGREATQIRTKLASAIEQNDSAAMQKWLEKARAFDAENIGSRAILPTIGSVIQQRAKARALAESGGTPLGVSPKDVQAQKLTSFYQPG